MTRLRIAVALVLAANAAVHADDSIPREMTLLAGLRHLRIDGEREWSNFPETPDAAELRIEFETTTEWTPQTLQLRQQNVKQTWKVSINDQPLGELVRDENDMVVYFAVPEDALRDGANTLLVRQQTGARSTPDDIRVGDVRLFGNDIGSVTGAARIDIEVVDADEQAIPCRLTIVNADGALQTVGVTVSPRLAVRPGVVYTADGRAEIGVPAGTYTIYAGRGFEYTLAQQEVSATAGEPVLCRLMIERVVPTEGYVACDTHVHTLTHSGHGDATVEERMVTLAGEGIELPIATDHNRHVDHAPYADRIGVRNRFTPVIGNEVTTPVGHFNIWPVAPGAKEPDHTSKDWGEILDTIYSVPRVEIAILNHARDVHSGVRPFGPENFNAAVGVNHRDWAMKFNAMEVINSGATQTDPLQLFHDWMALLNHGYRVTPVGSSDSHDVARHFVGQGRTYIRCDDRDPALIPMDAVESFVAGRVMVSYGLAVAMEVEGARSGETASVADGPVMVSLEVLGPPWVTADRVELFANGISLRSETISDGDVAPGVKWRGSWELPKPKHDVHLVAIATGPGIEAPYWRTALPYQPNSPDPTTHVIGCSGAIWLDVDGDGMASSAAAYAQSAFEVSGGDLQELLTRLETFDAAVAAQAAHLYQQAHGDLHQPDAQRLIRDAAPEVRSGITSYLDAWRECEIARVER